jgi:hypothetical protein
MLLDRGGGNFAVIDVAPVIAVEEPRCKFSQIALPDRLTAQLTESLLAGRPTIHDDEFHVPPPNEKQNTASAGWKLFGGGAQRWFRPSGLSRLRSTFCGGMRMYFPSSLRLA